MPVMTEIKVFHPNSRKVQFEIASLIPKQTVDALAERIGKNAGKKATEALKVMETTGADLIQFKEGDRRIRIKLEN
jgi:hypothetical protein